MRTISRNRIPRRSRASRPSTSSSGRGREKCACWCRVIWENEPGNGQEDRGSTTMADILTIAESEKQFDGLWVLVGDLQTTEVLEVQSGKVLFHSKDRDEV